MKNRKFRAVFPEMNAEIAVFGVFTKENICFFTKFPLVFRKRWKYNTSNNGLIVFVCRNEWQTASFPAEALTGKVLPLAEEDGAKNTQK